MTRRKNLQDQYEDAMFALLMDDLAWQEGERLLALNERLKDDPGAEVPEEVVARFRKVINRVFTKKAVLQAGRFSWNVFKRVAIAACMTVLLFSVAFATSETVRVSTMNLMIEVFDRYTDYSFLPTPSASDKARFSGFKVGWLPEGFTLIDEDTNYDESSVTYEDPHGEILGIDLYILGSNGTLGIDTENALTEVITINGQKVTFISKDYYQIVMPFEEKEQVLCVAFWPETTLLSKDQLIQIVENISFE